MLTLQGIQMASPPRTDFVEGNFGFVVRYFAIEMVTSLSRSQDRLFRAEFPNLLLVHNSTYPPHFIKIDSKLVSTIVDPNVCKTSLASRFSSLIVFFIHFYYYGNQSRRISSNYSSERVTEEFLRKRISSINQMEINANLKINCENILCLYQICFCIK